MNINWEELGYESREHYILQMAEDYDIVPETAVHLAEIMGDEELLDGFVTALQTVSAMLP